MPRSLTGRALAGLLVAVFAATPVSAGTPAVTLPQAPNCPVFPATNVWNKPVTGLDVHDIPGEGRHHSNRRIFLTNRR